MLVQVGSLGELTKLAAVVSTACALLIGSQAAATGFDYDYFPGISLADLVSGEIEDVDSKNGKLTFSNWNVDISGVATKNLHLYRILPLGGGFRLIAPLSSHVGFSSEMNLKYTVSGNDGLSVTDTSLAFIGIVLGEGTGLASETIYDGNTNIGSLEVASNHRSHDGVSKRDSLEIDSPLESFVV
jgi:hypothetical protein